ncbi:MAG TPA: DUF2059 domain-containing protein [Desulfopila sp.]|nr:DUF2059 domain-containing protein [Desulfopila sp.]
MKYNFFIGCILFSLTLLLLPISSAVADSKEEAIRELVEVMNIRNNLEASLETMEETIKLNSPYFLKEIKVILARDLDREEVSRAAEKYNLEDFGSTRLYELFQDRFNLDQIIEEVMVPVYGEHYSKEEIRQLIAFYNTDLGRKSIRLTPVISTAIAEKTRDASHTALTAAKEEVALELKKEVEK